MSSFANPFEPPKSTVRPSRMGIEARGSLRYWSAVSLVLREKEGILFISYAPPDIPIAGHVPKSTNPLVSFAHPLARLDQNSGKKYPSGPAKFSASRTTVQKFRLSTALTLPNGVRRYPTPSIPSLASKVTPSGYITIRLLSWMKPIGIVLTLLISAREHACPAYDPN
jgi:hypothetical protein